MARFREFTIHTDDPILVNLDQVLFVRESPNVKPGVTGSNIMFAGGTNQQVLESLHDIMAALE